MALTQSRSSPHHKLNSSHGFYQVETFTRQMSSHQRASLPKLQQNHHLTASSLASLTNRSSNSITGANHVQNSNFFAQSLQSTGSESVERGRNLSQPQGQVAMGLSTDERTWVRSASFVTDMSEANVVRCIQSLKTQGHVVSRESLIDECLKMLSQNPECRSVQVLDSGSSLQQTLSNNQSSETGSLGVAGADSRSNVPASLATASVSGPSQGEGSQTGQSASQLHSGGGSICTDGQPEPVSHDHGSSSVRERAEDDSVDSREDDVVDGGVVSSCTSSQDSQTRKSKGFGRKQTVSPPKSRRIQSTTSSLGKDGQQTRTDQGVTSAGHSNAVQNNLSKPLAGQKNATVSSAGRGKAKQNNLDKSSSTQKDGAYNNLDMSSGANREVEPISGLGEPAASQVEDLSHLTPIGHLDPAKDLALRLHLLQEENRLLDKARHCGECGRQPRDITFLPCGHVWACRKCAEPLYTCPCCNRSIVATVNTFLC